MKKTIAVMAGGDSSEYVVSLRSAKEIAANLNRDKYRVFNVLQRGGQWQVQFENNTSVDINKNDFSFLYQNEKVYFDCVFIAIHGRPGEDGKLQGYFDMLSIPYTTCDAITSALTFNKHFCSNYLHFLNLPMATSVWLRKGEEIRESEILDKVGLPCFVKPNKGGSSFGITKVKQAAALRRAIEDAFAEDPEILVESFIEGTEITCGLAKVKENEFVFPLTEIVSKNEFFDYEAKYTPTKVEEITPARISDELTRQCQQLSSVIYDALNCHGIVRIDYILNNNQFFFLEVNTIPGMTRESLVPQQIRAYGMTTEELYDLVIEDAIERLRS